MLLGIKEYSLFEKREDLVFCYGNEHLYATADDIVQFKTDKKIVLKQQIEKELGFQLKENRVFEVKDNKATIACFE